MERNTFFILLKQTGCHHVRTVTAQEHIIGIDVGTDLQLRLGRTRRRTECRTVTTTKDRTTDLYMLGLCTTQTDRNGLGMRTELIECLHRCLAVRNLIEIVTILQRAAQQLVICIRIRTVATAIDVA